MTEDSGSGDIPEQALEQDSVVSPEPSDHGADTSHAGNLRFKPGRGGSIVDFDPFASLENAPTAYESYEKHHPEADAINEAAARLRNHPTSTAPSLEATVAAPTQVTPIESSAQEDVATPNPGASGTYSASDLLALAKTENPWVVQDLIREGNQVVLSGPPKSGKTILALQLAIELTVGGGHFLKENHKIHAPARVLVISFEMRQRAMGLRLVKQTTSKRLDGLRFVFRSPNMAGSIFKYDPDADDVMPTAAGMVLKKIIGKLKPSLIIIDSLIQLHALDENNNLKMSALMRSIRKLCSTSEPATEQDYLEDLSGDVECVTRKADKEKNIGESTTYWRRTPIAHVIIHHTRKPPDNAKVYASPEAIRGASAIHSEADLALTLSVPWAGMISINKSSRELPAERTAYYVLKEERGRIFIELAPPKNLKKAEVFAQIYNRLASGETYALTAIQTALEKQELLKEITTSTGDNALKPGFYNRLQALNTFKSKRGPGGAACIRLAENTSWDDFATALFNKEPPPDVEVSTLPALEIPTFEGETTPESIPAAVTPASDEPPEPPTAPKKQPSTPSGKAPAKRRGRPPGKGKKLNKKTPIK